MMNIYEKRCAECAEVKFAKGGQMTCSECFGQRCADIDDCPLGITAESVESASKVDKKYKLCAQAEDKPVKKTRERKPNEDKLAIMSLIQGVLPEGTPVEVVNAERELLFVYNGVKYKLTLAVPRK